MNEPAVSERIRKLAPIHDDPDWDDVLRRADRLSPPTRGGTARHLSGRIRSVAVAVVGVAVAITALAITLIEGSAGHGKLAATSPGSKLACCSPAPGQTEQEAIQAFLKTHPVLAQLLKRHQHAASHNTPQSTGVRSLAAYTRDMHSVRASDLPASVKELIDGQRILNLGEPPTSVQEPIVGATSSGTPSIYLIRYPNDLCVVIAIKGAAGSCYDALTQAGGSISIDDSIVDGKRFIHGLVANDVSAITVSLAATGNTPAASVSATIENNVYLAPITYNGLRPGAVSISVTHTNGATTTIRLPAAPTIPTGH
jgi:hypothetical protein